MNFNNPTYDSVVSQNQAYSKNFKVGSVADLVTQAFSKLFSLVRAGAREANQIVPVQNQVADLLDLAHIEAEDPATSIQRLRELRQQLVEAGRAFNDFTRDSMFTDGRASVQARNTIFPLLDGTDGNGNKVDRDLWGNPVDGGTLKYLDNAIAARGGGGIAGAGDAGGIAIVAGLLGALALLK